MPFRRRSIHQIATGAQAGRRIAIFPKTDFKLTRARIETLSHSPASKLIVAATALHVILTVGIYLTGRLEISQTINENGLVEALAPDSLDYLPQIQSLAETMTHQGVGAWLTASVDLHLKLYSLAFALLGPWLGANILSAEPINLSCYVAIVYLTFKLGEEVFDRRVGFISAGAVALWPSFLLHTTQLLKDPLFIVALLALLLIIACWLTRAFPLIGGLKAGIAGGAAAYVISITRNGLWLAIVLVITLIGMSLALLGQVRGKRVLAGNVISAILVVTLVGILLLSTQAEFQAPPASVESLPAVSVSLEEDSTNAHESTPGRSVSTRGHPARLTLKERADLGAVRLSQLRHEFVRLNGDAGSNMDSEVEFTRSTDALRYLPRATMIGFLAPFPNQWLIRGKRVGAVGRLLSGLEMTAIYVIELLALIGLWRSRASLPAWLLCCVSVVGVVTLALVVINVGALYRMRYAFFILLFILGANGLTQILARKGKRVAFTG